MAKRLRNPELGALLRAACGDRFKGEEGIERLARLIAGRVGFPVSTPSMSAYLYGTRTPPAPVAEALAEELDLPQVEKQRMRELIRLHLIRLRQQRDAA